MKKIRDMERRGEREYHTPEYRTLYTKTRKHPKYENEIWTIKGDTKERSQKDVTLIVRI